MTDHRNKGGSYTRQKDGSLKLNSRTEEFEAHSAASMDGATPSAAAPEGDVGAAETIPPKSTGKGK